MLLCVAREVVRCGARLSEVRHARSSDRLLWPGCGTGRRLDTLESRSAFHCRGRGSGVRGRSRLFALSSALFSVRTLHHVLMIAAIAPLLALAFPQRRQGRPPLSALVAAHAIIVWVWHVPGIYAWGLATIPAYWLMQGSLLASAWLMWRAILAPAAQPGPALVALGATIGQMGLLGALIVFAPRPLYAVHFTGTWPWGLSPLADQQLAGLLMWVPAILPYLGAGLWIAWSSLRPGEPAV